MADSGWTGAGGLYPGAQQQQRLSRLAGLRAVTGAEFAIGPIFR